MSQAEALSTEDDLVRDVIGRLGQEAFGTGPLAELRRMDARQPATAPAALHRLLARLPEDRVFGRQFDAWTLLIHLLSLAAPEQHRGGQSLGQALLTAGYSEGRLTRLLDANEMDFPVILPRMVRFLVAHGERLNPFELAQLVLRRDKTRQRLRIARDYYRAEARQPDAG
jgi:CRISPR system Cascade subunit CasB